MAKPDIKSIKEEEINEEGRIKTGIEGFDRLCKGGFISESINLVMGNAGSGKTIFLLQFLYNGSTKYNENGLYISFEPDVQEIYKTGQKIGMDLEGQHRDGKIIFVKIDDDEIRVKDLQKKISKIVIDNNIKRICFDPLNVLSLNMPEEVNLRKQMFNLVRLFKQLGVCVLLAGEGDEDQDGGYKLTKDILFAKYLVDGIIQLFSSGISSKGDRALRITKMRMTNHIRGPVGMEITDKGINVFKS